MNAKYTSYNHTICHFINLLHEIRRKQIILNTDLLLVSSLRNFWGRMGNGGKGGGAG